MPAEIDANKLASAEPTMRTVDVTAILLMVRVDDQQHIQRTTEIGSILYSSLGTENIMFKKFSV